MFPTPTLDVADTDAQTAAQRDFDLNAAHEINDKNNDGRITDASELLSAAFSPGAISGLAASAALALLSHRQWVRSLR